MVTSDEQPCYSYKIFGFHVKPLCCFVSFVSLQAVPVTLQPCCTQRGRRQDMLPTVAMLSQKGKYMGQFSPLHHLPSPFPLLSFCSYYTHSSNTNMKSLLILNSSVGYAASSVPTLQVHFTIVRKQKHVKQIFI